MSYRLRQRKRLLKSPGFRPSVELLEGRLLLSTRQMEYLDRGVVAFRTGSGSTGSIYVGWRMLGTDPGNVSFNLYCSTNGGTATKINGNSPITSSTNFVQSSQNYSQSHEYFVRPVINGVEQPNSETYTLPANAAFGQHIDIPLTPPPISSLPDGSTYTYNANDCSTGDLDGDGQYEIILKWDPSNSKDSSQDGYTGPTYIDAYKLNGTRLWRINLGQNIRSGAHDTPFIVYDLDGDGKAELAVRTAPGTIDGQGNPVLLPGDQVTDDYRSGTGRINTGPEYLTIFNGLSGAAMATTPFLPNRGSISQWGDNYGNRANRFLVAVAYLDGQHPSLIMSRGYYGPQSPSGQARNEITAWDWRGASLSLRWWFKAGLNINGNINSQYIGQGAHSMNIADVDGDGRDEIIYGAAVIDDNGAGLYSTGLGHGDAMMTSDMDPSNPGQETFQVHEGTAGNGHIASAVRDDDAHTIIFSTPAFPDINGSYPDVGRGNAFDIDPRYPGFEFWDSYDSRIYNVNGTDIQAKPGNMFTNFGIWWDADPMRELLDGTTISDWRISGGVGGRSNLVSGGSSGINNNSGLSSNNSTKSTPCLVADLFGDWREEVVWRKSDNTGLQIWSTTITASNRTYTLMHDTQYRESVAWQNSGYNQPTSTSFFLGAADSSGAFPAIPTANIYLVGGPPAPATLSAAAVSRNRIDVNWSAVAGASGYDVKRATASGGPYTTVATNLAQTSFQDTIVSAGTTYYYVVSSVTAGGGQGADSAEVSAMTMPDAPAGLTATVVSSAKIDLQWIGSFGATSYIVKRSQAIGGPFTVLGTNITGTSFSDATVVSGRTYYYRVSAVDAGGESEDSLQAAATTPPTVIHADFQYNTPINTLTVQFSADVSQSLSVDDLLITSSSGSSVVPTGYSYDAGSNTASFFLPTPLPDDVYMESFVNGGVTDAQGNALAGDFSFGFYSLAGDANRDGRVDVADLYVAVQNWQKSNRTFSQGDFNHDGNVDLADLQILAANWGKTTGGASMAPLLGPIPSILPLSPPPPPPPIVVATLTTASKRTPTSVIKLIQ